MSARWRCARRRRSSSRARGCGAQSVADAGPAQDMQWGEEEGRSVRFPRQVAVPRRFLSKGGLPVVRMTEVAQHNKADDLWVIVHDKVYDLTAFSRIHPGGLLPLLNLAGRDATDAFTEYHPASVWTKQLPRYLKAQLHPDDAALLVDDFIRDHRKLRQQLLEQGAPRAAADTPPARARVVPPHPPAPLPWPRRHVQDRLLLLLRQGGLVRHPVPLCCQPRRVHGRAWRAPAPALAWLLTRLSLSLWPRRA